jgi:uncharacterized protein YceK
VTEESQRTTTALIILFAIVIAAASLAGCASSVQDDGKSQLAQDAYLSVYSEGMDHHGWAQEYFNNGTIAWENSDMRQAIADYANASMEYNAAADCYGQMARYAGSTQDREFGDSLRGCTFNLSLASDSFMNAAIAFEKNDTDKAYALFDEGRSCVEVSDAMLNRSIELIPAWLLNLSSA